MGHLVNLISKRVILLTGILILANIELPLLQH